MFPSKRKSLILFLIVLSGAGLSVMITAYRPAAANIKKIDPRDTLFAGSESCNSCHHNLVASHLSTAHYLTSRPASEKAIKGNFTPGKNELRYNQFMKVVMEKYDGQFVQSSRVNDLEMQAVAFDMVIGSGRKGQTYLFWKGSELFQLPVSYYTPGDSWVISPGYPLSIPRFDRIISGHCIECHGTTAKMQNDTTTTSFVQNSIIYGVDCERCHGPSKKHVDFQLANPSVKTAKYTTNPKQLNRQQQLDACALCHSGFRKELQPPFSFRTGDTLDQFSLATYNTDTAAALDVHGNQFGLLTASKCFRKSEMTCSSCHNTHREEVNDPQLFSNRCMSCHTNMQHELKGLKPIAETDLKKNCISCHMPMLPSKNIFLVAADRDKSSPDFVRTHRVGIYLPQIISYLDGLNKTTRPVKKH